MINMDAPILIASYWDLEFHVDSNSSNFVVGTMLAQNINGKCDQLIIYTWKILNVALGKEELVFTYV
jgi:hypothetical protein